MKKIALALSLVAMCFSSCDNKSRCTIEGTFENGDQDGKLVYVQVVGDIFKGDMKVVDSVEVKGGKFTLKPEVAENDPQVALISVGKITDESNPMEEDMVNASIILEKGTVKLNFKKDITEISGTERNDEFFVIQSKPHDIDKFYTDELAKFEGKAPTQEEQQAFAKKLQPMMDELQEMTFAFIKKNMKNSMGQALFVSSIRGLSEEKSTELLNEANEEFLNKDEIKQLKSMLDAQANKMKDLLNHPFKDVKINTPAGKVVSLSDYVGKGKYVLVDFWASWCAPCIAEIPFLTETYKNYKTKGFEIVSISIDQDETSWRDAMKEYNMTWVQTIDKSGDAATTYQVTGIPFTLLVNPEGVVIEANLRGEGLANKLGELIK